MAGKKRNKTQKRNKKSIQAKPSPQQIKAIDRLMEKDEVKQAITRLEALIKQYPKFSVLYQQGIDIYNNTNDSAKAVWTALRWTQNSPNSLNAWQNMYELSSAEGHLALAHNAIQKYNDLSAKQNADFVLDPELQESLEKVIMSGDLGNPKPASINDAILFDTGKVLLDAHCLKECLPYFDSLKNYPPAVNNNGVAQFQLGNIDGALKIYREAFEADDDNLHAKAFYIRLLVWNNQLDEANQIADKLKTARPTRPFYADAQLAALAFLGRYDEAFSCYQALNDEVIDDMEAIFYPLAGSIAYIVGEKAVAKKLWEMSTKDQYRGEKENPVSLLNTTEEASRKPALFSYTELFPGHWLDVLTSISEGDPDDILNKIRNKLIPRPSYEYMRLTYESCDDAGNYIIEYLLSALVVQGDTQAKQQLLGFFKSKRTNLDSKMKMMNRLRDMGVIDNKDAFEYWNGKELGTMKAVGFEIYREQKGNTLTDKDSELHQKAVSLMKKGDVKKSRKLLQQLIEQNPKEQSLRGNYAATWAFEDRERCIKEYEKTVKDFPDYLFARCMLANYKIEEGLLDDAEKLLGNVFVETTEYHISEYILISGVNAYLQAVKGEEKGALTYLESAEKVVEHKEEREALERWKERVDIILNPRDSFDFDKIDTKKLLNKIKNMKIEK